MKVYEYLLELTSRQHVVMPAGAELLSIQQQGDQWCLWARVDERAGGATRTIEMCGTGFECPAQGFRGPNRSFGRHIATTQDGNLVWHWFDMGELS